MRKCIIQTVACTIISLVAIGGSFAQTALSPNTSLLAQTSVERTEHVTVLVMAPDGAWGTATELLSNQAHAKAIADCKSKHRSEMGCGYRSTAIRAGWSIALRCGGKNILVAAKTSHAAEQAAIDSELRLRRDYAPGMPPCVRVVSVDPHGDIIAPDVGRLLRFVTDQGQ